MSDLLSMTVHELRCALIELEMERDALKAALREALDNWSNCREPDPYDKGARKRIAELRQLLGDKP